MTGRNAERTRGLRAIALLAPLFGLVAVAQARAQSLYDRNENVPVTSRSHPEYDAIGIPVGSFRMYPKFSLSGAYDDNVFGQSDKTSGFIVTAAPSLDFASNWSRNELNIDLRYQRDEYVEQSGQSSNEYSLNSNYRLDIDHASAATFQFNVGEFTEARTAPDSFAALAEPVRYDAVTADASVYREFNRFRVDADVGDSFYSFFNAPLINGQIFDESSRDEQSLHERIRGSWAVSPDIAVFVQVSPNQSRFLHNPTNGFSSFDSNGYSVTAGVNGQITHLITADVGLGYYSQDYDDPRISSLQGFAYNADIRYFPTQLVTVTARANHSIAPSGIPGTPATDLDSVGVRADYELRRFIIISPDFSYERYRYPGTDRVDNRYALGVSGTYLVNRTIGLTASYGFLRQDSNGAYGGASFDDNRLTLTLTLQR